MIIVDAGPLYAILDRSEAHHEACKRALASAKPPVLTTWPAFTEALYLVRRHNPRGHVLLWRLVIENKLELRDITPTMRHRMAEFMETYSPKMDLADASLVALAETERTAVVCTLDRSDFQTYRLPRKQHFTIIP